MERRPRCVGRRRFPGERADAFAIEVVALVVQRHRHVERVPRDHDEGGARVEGDPVERRVRLEEPPVLLRREPSVEVVTRSSEPIEPR